LIQRRFLLHQRWRSSVQRMRERNLSFILLFRDNPSSHDVAFAAIKPLIESLLVFNDLHHQREAVLPGKGLEQLVFVAHSLAAKKKVCG
jgi:hypothetical protein